MEAAVLDRERDLVGAGGKPERVLRGIPDQIERGEPHVDVEPRDPHRVVVEPLRRRQLLIRIDDGEPRAGKIGVLREAIGARQHVTAVQVHDRACALVVRPERAGVDRQIVRRAQRRARDRRVAQVVRVVDGDGIADGGFDRRPGIARARGPISVSPDRGRRQLGVQLLMDLAHRDVIGRCASGRARGRLRDGG